MTPEHEHQPAITRQTARIHCPRSDEWIETCTCGAWRKVKTARQWRNEGPWTDPALDPEAARVAWIMEDAP